MYDPSLICQAIEDASGMSVAFFDEDFRLAAASGACERELAAVNRGAHIIDVFPDVELAVRLCRLVEADGKAFGARIFNGRKSTFGMSRLGNGYLLVCGGEVVA